MPRPTLRASFEVNLCPILNTHTHTVAKPLSLAKRRWLVGENPTRNDSVTVVRNKPTLRRSPRREKRQWLGLLCGLNFMYNFQTEYTVANEDGLLARIQRERTLWPSFKISRRFAAHHAESLAANRWSLRHSDHEEVTNHRAHSTPLIRIHTHNGIVNFSMDL